MTRFIQPILSTEPPLDPLEEVDHAVQRRKQYSHDRSRHENEQYEKQHEWAIMQQQLGDN